MTNLAINGLLERVEKFKSAPAVLVIFLIGSAVRYSTKHEALLDFCSFIGD